MGKPSRDKGARREREVVNALRALGIKAERVPLSGAAHYQSKGHDIDVYPHGCETPIVGEIKGRKKFPAWLRGWLADNDFLVMVEDQNGVGNAAPERMVVLPWRMFVGFVSEGGQCDE